MDNAHGGAAKKKGLNKHSGLLVWWGEQLTESCRYRNRLTMFAQINFANVRIGPIADISFCTTSVRSNGQSRHGHLRESAFTVAIGDKADIALRCICWLMTQIGHSLGAWLEVSHQLDETIANNFGPLGATGGGSGSGTWSVANFGGYSDALLVVKAADGFVAYLLNTSFTSGTWSTLGIFNGGQCATPPVLDNGCNHPDVSHLALYEGGDFTPPNGSPPGTPIPGALWLFGTVIVGGAGFSRWRKRRKAAVISN